MEARNNSINQQRKEHSVNNKFETGSTIPTERYPKGILVLAVLNFIVGLGYSFDGITNILENLPFSIITLGIGLLGILSALELFKLKYRGWKLTILFNGSVCVNTFLQILDPVAILALEKQLYYDFSIEHQFLSSFTHMIQWSTFLTTIVVTGFLIYYLILVEDHFY